MAGPDLVNLSGLLDDAKCFALVRQHCWPDGVRMRAFYAAARGDPLLGPVFGRVADWEPHIARVCAFWSSVARMTGRYHGNPMAAHLPLGLDPAHFARWLALFEATARAECTAEGAEHLIERARRIARGLEMGIAVQRGELPPARRRRH